MAPAGARTGIAVDKEQDRNAEAWVCRACGCRYEPIKGDPDHWVPPHTRFEDLPARWTCPVCGVTKAQFEMLTRYP